MNLDYKQGLEDAWHAMRMLLCKNGIPLENMSKNNLSKDPEILFNQINIQFAINKVKEYEDMYSVKIGDEVKSDCELWNNMEGVVLKIHDNNKVATIMDINGNTSNYPIKDLIKTGTHYSALDNLFEDMKLNRDF